MRPGFTGPVKATSIQAPGIRAPRSALDAACGAGCHEGEHRVWYPCRCSGSAQGGIA